VKIPRHGGYENPERPGFLADFALASGLLKHFHVAILYPE